MIQAISIENFRCFHRSHFEGFKMVNLIGGKNNSGKTSLLEAILLSNAPTPKTINFLQALRTENTEIYIEYPELAWSNYFFNQDKTNPIKMVSQFGTQLGEYLGEMTTDITCIEREKKLSTRNAGHLSKNGEDDLIKVIDSGLLSEVGISRLDIETKWLSSQYKCSVEYAWRKAEPEEISSQEAWPFHSTVFIPTGFKPSSASLAREFDRAKSKGRAEAVTKALRLIDNTIEAIETINLGEPKLYIKRKGFAPQPLQYFGDALNKVVNIIMKMDSIPLPKILLIDEIENGIHHTNQEELWKMLMLLASQNNVQMFCTSHSGEMINAFKRASAASNGHGNACYFELIKSARTGEIVANALDNETLGYNLITNHPFRGE